MSANQDRLPLNLPQSAAKINVPVQHNEFIQSKHTASFKRERQPASHDYPGVRDATETNPEA